MKTFRGSPALALLVFRSNSRLPKRKYASPSCLSGSIYAKTLGQRRRLSDRKTALAMGTELIDVDCNLWHADLKTLQGKDIDADDCWNILKEDAIQRANIVAMLSPSSTIDEAERGLQLMMKSPPPIRIKTTVGIHPYHVNDDGIKSVAISEHRKRMKKMLKNDLVSAVGECGLDASDGFPPLEDQLPLFRLQVELANEFNLPLFVHERLAFSEALAILGSAEIPVIIHCFTGTKEQCIEYVKRGYFISVSGYILKETNDNYDEVISCLDEDIIPLSRLMIETDAPYMGFQGNRQLYLEHNEEFVSSLNAKKRKRLQQSIYPNVPSSLPLVLGKVADCYAKNNPQISLETIASATTENARSFFGL